MEVIPYTLAENAGLNPIQTVTELRARHSNGEVNCGINVRKVWITLCIDYLLAILNLIIIRLCHFRALSVT